VEYRSDDPATSREAAGAASEQIKGRVRQLAYKLLAAGAATDEELWEGYELLMRHGVAPKITDARLRHCRKDLERQGLITATGERRANKSGSRARVWAVV
jgi:hypothetical protein